MFSIVTIFNQNIKEKKVKNFFTSLEKLVAKKSDIEIIFILDNKNFTNLDLIEQLVKKFNTQINVKFIFSSKTTSLNDTIRSLVNLVSKNYILFLSSDTTFETSVLSKIETIIAKNNVDILEFKPNVSGLIKWDPKNRLAKNILNTSLNINKNGEIIAYTFPFIFNKIISRKTFIATVKNNLLVKSKNEYSNYLFTKFIYFIFLNAQSYYYLPDSLIQVNLEEDLQQNFNDVLNTWNSIEEEYSKTQNFFNEIKYAKYYYLKIILTSIYSMQGESKIKKIMKKNNLITKKYYEKISKLERDEFLNFALENRYMIANDNKEVELLKNQKNDLNTWDKIFGEI